MDSSSSREGLQFEVGVDGIEGDVGCIFLFSALAISLSDRDMNWRSVAVVMWSLMVLFFRAVRSAFCFMM